MEYNFKEIEKKWQEQWQRMDAFTVSNNSAKPKFYVLDMFPYPSGAGLHVGHPLGYIASDIYSRYKRLKGFNVLHPMGYDSFGLPAEQYAMETGQHPAITTEENIRTFRSQLDKIGFSYDWIREVRTSDPKYYKWTQWIFLQLFNAWYDRNQNKARSITDLINIFNALGNKTVQSGQSGVADFDSEHWKSFDERTQQDILMHYRLAYSSYGEVNWCEDLGTVLANDEVVNGVSERGGHPVVKKKMRQWYLRMTEYADRLLNGLEKIEFTESLKEQQRNWIGKSEGCEITFRVKDSSSQSVLISSGRPYRQSVDEADQSTKSGMDSVYSSTDILIMELANKYKEIPTQEENLLWESLRRNQTGHHIERQHIIEHYVVDFVCLDKKVVIQIDEGYYETEEQRNYDQSRTAYLESSGFEEIRFTNEGIRNDINSVVEEIMQKLDSGPSAKDVSLFGQDVEGAALKVYTTRPDTIFGVDFMVLAPEHELVSRITSPDQQKTVDDYLDYVKSRSERERMAEVKQITGCFTGAYAINPFDGREIPIWIAEYVLAGYGTGAIMAVPCGDQRDFNFATYFNIPITNIIGAHFNGQEANPTKDAVLENSGFLNGIVMKEAMGFVINKLEEMGIGKRQVNYRMRDAGFSRQRYWGEPFPIIWKDGIAYPLDEKELPLELPHVDKYEPGPDGEGPLANIPEWIHIALSNGGWKEGARETSTMPGYAGSSWYFLRYMDPYNDNEFCSREVSDYWGQVDLYIGGTEHAVGHLLYSRMWTKVLYDLGYIGHEEPYKKLVNQGMITGVSQLIHRWSAAPGGKSIFNYINYIDKDGHPATQPLDKKRTIYYSADYTLSDQKYESIHIPIHFVDDNKVDIASLITNNQNFEESVFACSGGYYLNGVFIPFLFANKQSSNEFYSSSLGEKMSKSKLNTINPDEIVEKYGADTFRMYEMFLGPIEQSKPWDAKGIEGAYRFLRKLWRLFYDETKGRVWNTDTPTEEELKVLHRTIKKIEDDTENFSFNTAVSAFMVCVNELTDLKCYKKEILEPLLIVLAPYAPHVAEELYHHLKTSSFEDDLMGPGVLDASYPNFEEKYLVETSKEYPVSVNGKVRTTIGITLDASQEEVEKIVLANETVQKWIESKQPKKIIYIKNKMINVVI